MASDGMRLRSLRSAGATPQGRQRLAGLDAAAEPGELEIESGGSAGSFVLLHSRIYRGPSRLIQKRGQSEDAMPETRASTDAAMSGLSWVVGESYRVHDAVDRLVDGRWSGLPGYYNPKDRGRDGTPRANGSICSPTTTSWRRPSSGSGSSRTHARSSDPEATGLEDHRSTRAWRTNSWPSVRATKRRSSRGFELTALSAYGRIAGTVRERRRDPTCAVVSRPDSGCRPGHTPPQRRRAARRS